LPELPEVETVSKDLSEHLIGETISDIGIIDARNLRGISPANFVQQIRGTKISNIYRKGKTIIWNLTNNLSIIIHLRMTGKFILTNNNAELTKHDMIVFKTKKWDITFNDVRKFATINLTSTNAIEDLNYFKNIGIDPTKSEFTFDNFKYMLKKGAKKSLKAFLLEQDKIVGIGNIYASEILFDSKINPERLGYSLSKNEEIELFSSIKKIILQAIMMRGTTFSDYRDGFNKKGEFQNQLKVYNKLNENCIICKDTINKIKQNGRSTYYCQTCQK